VNKRILFGVLMICAVAALVAIGTWAYFSDYETSYDNKFTAGSLDLKVDGMDDPNVATYFNVECVKPGDNGAVPIVLTNVGCVDGIADIHLKWLANDENVAEEPELNAGDVADDPANVWDGELAQNLDMKISADLDFNGSYETVVAEGKLEPDVWCINWTIGPLDADSSIGLLIEWSVAPTVGNIIMTDIVKFDIEFSLNQAVGLPFEPHLSNLVQPATAVVCDTVTITVDVTNAGDIGGSVTVSLDIGALPPMEKLVSLAGGQTKTATFTWHAEPAGDYPVVASLPSEEHLDCSIKVLEPSTLWVTGIQQVPMIQICEELTVSVDVHNAGGVPGEGIAWVVVANIGQEVLAGPFPVPTGMVDPCEIVKLPLTIGHVEESWRGMVFVVAGMVPSEEYQALCPLVVLKPGTLEVTGIQQATTVQVGEPFAPAVDVHNGGDKPLAGAVVTLTITNAGGVVLKSDTLPVPTLNPCDTGKVPFGPYTTDSTWLGVNTVTTTPSWVGHVHTVSVLTPASIVVTGIQQPETAYVCDMLTLAVDVHNAGGKAGSGSVTLWVEDSIGGMLVPPMTVDTAVLAPCQTVKIPFGPFHVDETWMPGVVVKATSTGTVVPVVCEIAVSEVPYLKVSSTWDYDVNYSLGGAGGETISAVVTEALTLGPVNITVKYTNQAGLTKFAPAVTIPANSPVNTVVPIPLFAGDTGVQDIQTASKTATLTTGVVALLGNTSGILGGSLDLKLAAAYYTDGMAFYILEDTVMTTHLLELNVAISDMLTECTQVPVPPGPANHAAIDPSMGGLLPPVRALPGTPYSMATMTIDAWSSPTDGTAQYVYLTAMLLGIIPMEVEVGYHTYTLTGGANIGEPYTVGSSWTYISETDAYAASACSGYALATISVSVVAGNVSVMVPAGTFNDCFQITTDNPLLPGIKTDYWSPTVMGIVKTVNSETYYPGVETTVLTSYTLNW